MDNQEISKITMWAMIAVALFFDAIQIGVLWIYLIPFVGFFLAWAISTGVSIFAFLTFFLWFHLAGLKFNRKIATSTIVTFLIELVPVASGFFTWTISITANLILFQTKKIAGKIAPGSEKLIGNKTGNNRKSA